MSKAVIPGYARTPFHFARNGKLTTGGKTSLRGITKRGNTYLRYLFVHGARAVCRHRRPHRLGWWLAHLEARAHPKVVVVALANELARTAWVVLQREVLYDGQLATA